MAATATMYNPSLFNHSVGAVQANIRELSRPQTVYQTVDTDREMRMIDNGISHIRLDDTFLTGSRGWHQQVGPQRIHEHHSAVTNTMGKGSQFLSTYRQQMAPTSINRLQDNQVREQHQWAVQNLQGLRQEMAPLATDSHQRVQQFCDWVGVTDRYTGYRHNLSRPKEPLQYQPYWRRGPAGSTGGHIKFAPEIAPQRVVAPRWNVRSRSAPPPSERLVAVATHQSYPTKTPQEAAGMVVKYPGISEYKDRFKRPNTSGGPVYGINPAPDFGVLGRPLITPDRDQKSTEYNVRYEWPNGAKIESFPWRRGQSKSA